MRRRRSRGTAGRAGRRCGLSLSRSRSVSHSPGRWCSAATGSWSSPALPRPPLPPMLRQSRSGRVARRPTPRLAVAVTGALVVMATCQPVVAWPGPQRVSVVVGQVGAIATAVGVLLSVVDADRLWLALLAAGVAAGVAAVRGIERNRLGWVSGALLAASTWVRLALSDVDAPEPYTAPSGIALLVVGYLRRRRDPSYRSWPAYAPRSGAGAGAEPAARGRRPRSVASAAARAHRAGGAGRRRDAPPAGSAGDRRDRAGGRRAGAALAVPGRFVRRRAALDLDRSERVAPARARRDIRAPGARAAACSTSESRRSGDRRPGADHAEWPDNHLRCRYDSRSAG